MKKLILSGMVVMFAAMIKTEDVNHQKFSQKIKNKYSHVVLSTKAGATSVLSYCQNLAAQIREPNYKRIERAFEAMQRIQSSCDNLKIGVDTEVELLQNIKQLGFDKHNATSALKLFTDSYEIMESLLSRYKGVAPWNWSKKMEDAALQVARCISEYKIYKLYFEGHEACLHAWQLLCKYDYALKNETLTPQSMLDIIQNFGKHDKEYSLLTGYNILSRDVAFIKSFLQNLNYSQKYAELYQSLYLLFPSLEIAVDQVKQNSEYQSQLQKQDNKSNKS